MDKRLILEIVPGPAFLVGHALGGIFTGAVLATLATGVAVALRWRWDRRLPWMAISILGLTLVMLIAGLLVDDERFVKVSNTLGSLVFAVIIGVGMAMRPSLLQRTLGYSISMAARGWTVMHVVWIGVSLARAGVNEVVWRSMPDDAWAIYNGISDILWIAILIGLTWVVAYLWWEEAA
jgi:intracellular septation protein